VTPTADRAPVHGFALSFTIAILSMLAPFSIDTYLPSLPDIAREFAAPEWQVQQTLSVYLIAFAITTLVYGPLSDTFGRRSVILVTVTLYTISSIGCALASDIHWLLAMRVGQGLAASGAVVVGRAIVRDAFSGARAQRAMSHVMLVFAVAPAAAPIIGGYLHDAFGWRSVFWFLALLGLALWVWVALRLPETLPPPARQPAQARDVGRAYGDALKHRQFMLIAFCVALNFGGLFLYVTGSPAVLYEHLGMEADDFGYLFVPLVVGLMGGAFISGRLAGRFTHQQAANLGFGVMLGAGFVNVVVASSVTPTLVTVVAPVMFYSLGMSIAMPNLTLLGLDCFPARRGLASAVQSFMHMSFNAVVAGLFVPLLSHRLWSMAGGQVVLVVMSLLLWSWYRRDVATRTQTTAHP
jgi:MFS transporter, DHA1 family, multidrug resistance protein